MRRASSGIRDHPRARICSAAIVNEKRGVGVSGTHGKTTTSAMIATVLEDAGLDPTIIIGGILQNFASNAKDGKGDVVVVEADEYDRTFHELRPEIAVITNIEADHLEYYGSFETIVEAFRIFAEDVRPGGAIIGCVDDPRGRGAARSPRPRQDPTIIRYGLGAGADVTRARTDSSTSAARRSKCDGIGFFKLFVPGEHNVRNALAAIAVARELGVAADAIAAGIAKFLGVDRRFQILGDYNGALVVDDYAHHPTEIRPRSTPRAAAIRSGASSRSSSRISTRARAISRRSSPSRCAAPTSRSSRRSTPRAKNRSKAISSRMIAERSEADRVPRPQPQRDHQRAAPPPAAERRLHRHGRGRRPRNRRSARARRGRGEGLMSAGYDSTSPRFFRPTDVARLRRNQRRIQLQRIRFDRRQSRSLPAASSSDALLAYRHTQGDARFAVKAIEIAGATHTPRAAIDAVTHQYIGANLFRIDIARLQADLRAPRLGQADRERRRNCPTRCASASSSASRWRSRADGDRMHVRRRRRRRVRASFRRRSATAICRSSRNASGAELARCVALVRELRTRDPQIYSRISEVRPVAPNGFALFDRELGAFVYADEGDLSAKWRDLYAVARAEHLGTHDIEYADLRFAGRIVVKPVHPAALAPVAPQQPIATQITN